MDGWLKALLTAVTVALVVWLSQRAGRWVAGLVAALPTVTAPTLAWLALDRSLAFAVNAAIASVAACAMLAGFALGYVLAARCRGGPAALAGGLFGALAMAPAAIAAASSLPVALALALGAISVALAAMPVLLTGAVVPRQAAPALASTAFAAGGLSALAAALGPWLGSFAVGLLSSLPVASGTVAMAEHARGGHAAAARFLRGYVAGLFGKAAFGAVFAMLAVGLGAMPALAIAAAIACAASVAAARVLGPRAAGTGSAAALQPHPAAAERTVNTPAT